MKKANTMIAQNGELDNDNLDRMNRKSEKIQIIISVKYK